MSGITDVCTLPPGMPKLSVSASSPFLPKLDTASPVISESPLTNQTNECKDALKPSLPLNLFFTTSKNTTLSLQLSELIETNTANIETDKPESQTPKRVKFNFDSPQQALQDYMVGDLVIASLNKQGLIRYIGPLHGDAHVWYGIELIGGSKGFNDGSFQGRRYFTCGIHQGIFVKKHQIVRKMKKTDFENGKPRRPKTAKVKKKGNGKQEKRHSLTGIDLKRVQRKPGPREIGRIAPTSNWTPIEDADKIIDENKGSFLQDRGRRKKRQRPKTARNASSSITPRPRSSSRHEMMKAKSKMRINKSVTLVPDSFDKMRSKTPTPSRYGLTVIKLGQKEDDDTKDSTDDTTRSKVKASFDKRGRVRSSSRDTRRKKKKRKDKRENERHRSKTVQFDRSALTKSKSVPDRKQPMITFSFEERANINTGFPDIATLGDTASETRGRTKKMKKGKGKHMQSKSQGGDTDPAAMVIIRVSSEKNVDRRFLGTQGLNMSETSTIPMNEAKDDDDDLMFAEVNAEIEQRKSGLMELEQQLDALGIDDFNKQFENSLLQTKSNQTRFTKRHSALVDKLEFDITKDLKIEQKDGLSSNKVKNMLWSDLNDLDPDAHVD